MSFAEQGYEVVRNAISKDAAKLLALEFEIHKECFYYFNGHPESGYHGDQQVERSFSWYSAYGFEALLQMQLPSIETIVSKELYPAYE